MTVNVEEIPPAEERVGYHEGAYGHLAAKADVADVRTAIAETETCVIQRIAESETRITQRIVESETRIAGLIAELRAEIAKSQTETTRLMVIGGFIIVGIALLDRLLG